MTPMRTGPATVERYAEAGTGLRVPMASPVAGSKKCSVDGSTANRIGSFGRTLDRDMLRRGSGIASEETQPVSDTRGSSVYKREMVKVLCRHALETAAGRAGVQLET